MRLVLCYGNTLRGDDGFGPAVASYLEEKICQGQSLEILCKQQLLPEHAERVARSSLVIFVDASQACEIGHIGCVELASVSATIGQKTQSVFPHAMSPSTILELAESVYGHRPEAYIYTVGIASLELGEKLSPLIEKAVPMVAEMILSKLGQVDGSLRV